MMEPVSYHISEADYASFLELLSAQALPRLALMIAALVALVSLFAFALGDPFIGLGAIIGGIAAFFVAPIVGRNYTIPRNAAKAFHEYALIQEEMTLELTVDGFSIAQKSGYVTMPWSQVVMWNESDEILALHPNSKLAYILPRGAIGSERAEYIGARLLESGLLQKGKRRK